MRRLPPKIRVALCGAALLLAAAPAIAEPINPASLVPSLDVYVDSVAAGHAAAQACTDPKSPARDEAAWTQAKGMLIATLWANGFPIDFVRTAGKRLDAAAPAAKPNCTDPVLAAALGTPNEQGWMAAIQHPLAGMDLKIVNEPVSTDTWNKIKAAFAAEIPPQKRLFECTAVSAPEMLPTSVHDWDLMLMRIGEKLAAAGLPRDEVSAQLSAAEANTLWHRVAPDAEAGLRDSCTKEQGWQDRLYQFQTMRLAATVDKLLPPSDTDNN